MTEDIRNCTIYHGKEEVFRGPLDLSEEDLIKKHYPGTYIVYEDRGGIIRDHKVEIRKLKNWLGFRIKRACSLMVEYLACTEETRVQLTAGPFRLNK